MKKFINEFKEFISRGNVMDMAVGIVIGTAFTKIINSIVSDIIMPIIGTITGRINLSTLKLIITPASEGVEELAIKYGNFLQAVVDFVIIAFAIFCAIKVINSIRNKLEKKQEEEKKTEPPKPSNEEVLLTEIRDLLKK